MLHEFVCADCESDVFSFGGPEEQTRCASCETIREMKERDPMTPEAEAALREILGCVIPVSGKPGPTKEPLFPPDEP
jgi:DNA-directed RNA polymerase subunit RPC12/RpoP